VTGNFAWLSVVEILLVETYIYLTLTSASCKHLTFLSFYIFLIKIQVPTWRCCDFSLLLSLSCNRALDTWTYVARWCLYTWEDIMGPFYPCRCAQKACGQTTWVFPQWG
jgi:hypothetical protein